MIIGSFAMVSGMNSCKEEEVPMHECCSYKYDTTTISFCESDFTATEWADLKSYITTYYSSSVSCKQTPI
ncbi:MAG: hypothetical protein OEW75_10895 [Cyclobacteriaceae bacterium]|nr:hypothetical protein [Cyclobacteriaceae bacterium]